ncbi:MAG: type IV pilin-like G/H family protein [Cyanobacteria bacterium P01_A01_bin.84]
MKAKFKASQNYNNFSPQSILFSKGLGLTTIILSIALGSISGCNSSSNAQSASEHKWSGEWQLKDPAGSGQSVKVILTPKGKLYLIPPSPGTKEPTAYDVPLERVSDNTSLPTNIKVVSLKDTVKKQANKARSIEGKTYVGSMNRAQQAYILENNKFATNLKELQIGIKSETDNYTYKVVSPPGNKSVMNMAQAKRTELNSYVGLVYVSKVNGENTTFTKLCQTNQSISKPPEMPTISTSGKIQCPSGFQPLR